MAGGVDVGATLVDGGVDDEAGFVDEFVCAANPVALFIDVDEVRHFDETKVDAIRVDPEGVWLNGVFVWLSVSKVWKYDALR